jgi:tetratricopeptide (TPR) repeat protein
MGFREEFRGPELTQAIQSLQTTTASGLEANQERLQKLQAIVSSRFNQGIDRIVESQDALRGELAYRAAKIAEEIRQGSADVVGAIQQMSDYLGSGLCEIRWAVERQTRVSQDILQVLLTSLDNQSRQYWEQGVKCYDAAEYDIAKERFDKAVEANRTNDFAYQYLGFIAVAKDSPEEAIRNFELAHKFAHTGYHKALALSHLARSLSAKGELKAAADMAKGAANAYPEAAKFHYELAAYSARLGLPQQACAALKEAIERDWTYWEVVIADRDFDSIRPHVNKLLDELRERERKKAMHAVSALNQAMEMLRKVNPKDDLTVVYATVPQRLEQNNVHVYREVAAEAWSLTEKAYSFAEAAATRRLSDLEDSIRALRLKVNEVETAYRKPCSAWAYLGFWFLSFIPVVFAFMVATSGFNEHEFALLLIVPTTCVLAWIPCAVINRAAYYKRVVAPKRRLEEEIGRWEQQFGPVMAELKRTRKEISEKVEHLGKSPASAPDSGVHLRGETPCSEDGGL